MRLLATLLLLSFATDVCWSQCRTANWWKSFDHKGWSKCGSPSEYMTGLWRNDNYWINDQIRYIEEARCCRAPAPYQGSPSTCREANWWKVLDSKDSWAVCPVGYFLQGLYRNDGEGVSDIELGKCCRPSQQKAIKYGHCYEEDVAVSFDREGLSKCKDGFYMAGIFRGSCNSLYCIEKFKCCRMHITAPVTKPPATNPVQGQCRMANWWGSLDQRGWSTCGSRQEYINGLWRNDRQWSDDTIRLIEEARCCRAPAPNQNTPSVCRDAIWSKMLLGANRWAACPVGYFLHGLYRNDGERISDLEKAKCCRPQSVPDWYGDCYTEDVALSFDKKGLSKCRDGYFVVGIFKGICDQLYCLEKFKCCSIMKVATTKRSSTKAPTTKAPTTKATTTKAPTTKAPSTKAPSTKAPTTKAPTTKAPTTKASTTKAFKGNQPTTTEPDSDPECSEY